MAAWSLRKRAYTCYGYLHGETDRLLSHPCLYLSDAFPLGQRNRSATGQLRGAVPALTPTMMNRRLAGIITSGLLAFAVAAPAAHAQRPPSVGRTVAGSVLGAATGAVAGALAGGSWTSRNCPTGDPDACLGAAFPGAIWGVGVGTTIGAPVGAWLGSGRQRSLAPPMIASAALFAAEVLALRSIVHDGRTRHKDAALAIVIVTPIAQVVTSSWLAARR